MSAETISGATGLSVEQICEILQEPAISPKPPACEGCEE
jgi:hypothetical protein